MFIYLICKKKKNPRSVRVHGRKVSDIFNTNRCSDLSRSPSQSSYPSQLNLTEISSTKGIGALLEGRALL